jgi:hypothetical protein
VAIIAVSRSLVNIKPPWFTRLKHELTRHGWRYQARIHASGAGFLFLQWSFLKVMAHRQPAALSCAISAGVKPGVGPTRVHSIRILAGGGSNILILCDVSAASAAGAAVAVSARSQGSNSGNTL